MLYGAPCTSQLGRFAVSHELLKTLCLISEAQGAWKERARHLDDTARMLLRESAAVETERALAAIMHRTQTPEGLVLLPHDAASISAYSKTFRGVESLVARFPPTLDELKNMHAAVSTDQDAGRFRTVETSLGSTDKAGRYVVNGRSVAVRHLGRAMHSLLAEAERQRHLHPVLVVSAFSADLLTVHPFLDGNGRLLRLVAQASLISLGHAGLANASFERFFQRERRAYFDAILSTTAWRERSIDPQPWAMFFAGIVLAAYEELLLRAESIT